MNRKFGKEIDKRCDVGEDMILINLDRMEKVELDSHQTCQKVLKFTVQKMPVWKKNNKLRGHPF